MKPKLSCLLAIVVMLSAASMIWQCNLVKEDPLSATNFKISDMSTLTSGGNIERSTFYPRETIILSLDKLLPQCQTRIEVLNVATDEVVRALLVMSDIDGKIDSLVVWYNIGVDAQGNLQNVAGDYFIHVLQLNVRGLWNNVKIPFSVAPAPAPFAMIWPSTADGKFQGGAILRGTAQYAAGSGFAANAAIHLYVCNHVIAYNPGDPLVDVSGGAENVTTDGAGAIPPTKVWATANTIGIYNLIADTAPFGQYNTEDVIFNRILSSFTVVDPPAYTDLIQDIACNVYGLFQDNFATTDAIFGRSIPSRLPAYLQEHVAVYIMGHKALWHAGDPLVNILNVNSISSPIYCLMDPTSGVVQTLELRGETKLTDPYPIRLAPCAYDVIIDVNLNRLYDPGIDILDGGPRPGFIVGDGSCTGTGCINLTFTQFGEYWDCGIVEKLLRVQVLDSHGQPIPDVLVHWKLDKGTGSIDPLMATTDADGIAESHFSGAAKGDWAQVRAYAYVGDCFAEKRIYIWGNLCYTHNQGVVIGY